MSSIWSLFSRSRCKFRSQWGRTTSWLRTWNFPSCILEFSSQRTGFRTWHRSGLPDIPVPLHREWRRFYIMALLLHFAAFLVPRVLGQGGITYILLWCFRNWHFYFLRGFTTFHFSFGRLLHLWSGCTFQLWLETWEMFSECCLVVGSFGSKNQLLDFCNIQLNIFGLSRHVWYPLINIIRKYFLESFQEQLKYKCMIKLFIIILSNL